MNAIKGKEFEKEILFRASKLEEAGILSLGRYGTQVVMMNDDAGKPAWQPIPSLPDMEGVIIGPGRQIIIEAKVCSGPHYKIAGNDDKHPKQLSHMLRRAEQGALCFLMIHFNERRMVKKHDPCVTVAIPVRREDYFWRMYLANELKTVSRDDAINYGIQIPWNVWSSRASKLTPDLTFLLPEKPTLELK